jgi:hypothetical protein
MTRIQVGDRVRHTRMPEFTGQVLMFDNLTCCGKVVEVAVVKWDGNPKQIPMLVRDESGSGTKSGYLPECLEVVQ